MADERPGGTYEGYKWKLTSWWRFQIEEHNKDFGSYDELKIWVDDNKAKIAASNRVKLKLTVIDSKGTDRVITGVHATIGSLIITPKSDDHRCAYYFPPVAWIEAAIAERHHLRDEAEKIDDALKKFQINQRGYSTTPKYNPDMHSKEVARVRDDYEAKLKAAQETSLQKEREKLAANPKRKIKL